MRSATPATATSEPSHSRAWTQHRESALATRWSPLPLILRQAPLVSMTPYGVADSTRRT